MKATALVHAYVALGRNAGAETYLHGLFRGMVAQGWEVDVILSQEYPGFEDEIEIDGVTLIPYSDKRQIIRAANASQLLVSHLECSDRVAMVGKAYRVPTVQVIHNDLDVTKGYLLHGADLAVFNTNWVSDSHSDYRGKRVVVHPRIDPSRFPLFDTHGDSITLVNLWKGSIVKTRNTARHGDGKGPDVFYEMAKRFPEEKFLGVLGGYGEQDIREGSEYPNVTIIPQTEFMASEVYSKSKLVLMPSRYESFGMVAMEAASCGVPSVVSNTKGLMEAFGSYGNYALPGNYDDWEINIEAILGRHASASKDAYDASSVWRDKQEEEFEAFNTIASNIAQNNYFLRGW